MGRQFEFPDCDGRLIGFRWFGLKPQEACEHYVGRRHEMLTRDFEPLGHSGYG